MARMFTREAVEEGIKVCNEDAAHLERAKLLSGIVVLRAYDTPDGKDVAVTYTFEQGRCVDYDFQEADAPSVLREDPFVPMKDGLARITASYATFVALDKGEMDPADALNSPDYKIEGNMMMLLPLMQAVNSWTEKVRELPKTY